MLLAQNVDLNLRGVIAILYSLQVGGSARRQGPSRMPRVVVGALYTLKKERPAPPLSKTAIEFIRPCWNVCTQALTARHPFFPFVPRVKTQIPLDPCTTLLERQKFAPC